MGNGRQANRCFFGYETFKTYEATTETGEKARFFPSKSFHRNLPKLAGFLWQTGCHHFFILSSKVLLSSLARFFNWFALKLSGIDSLQIHARREIKINILKLRQRWPQTRLEREGSERRLQDDFRNQWGIHQFGYSPVTSRHTKKFNSFFVTDAWHCLSGAKSIFCYFENELEVVSRGQNTFKDYKDALLPSFQSP